MYTGVGSRFLQQILSDTCGISLIERLLRGTVPTSCRGSALTMQALGDIGQMLCGVIPIHIIQEETLVCSSHVLVETYALVQNRLGMTAVRVLHNAILPMINVELVDELLHRSGVGALITAGRRRLSLVDCTSLETMRRLGTQLAFTLDQHFAEQGFDCLP